MRLETFMEVQLARLRGHEAILHGGYHKHGALRGSVEQDERTHSNAADRFCDGWHQHKMQGGRAIPLRMKA